MFSLLLFSIHISSTVKIRMRDAERKTLAQCEENERQRIAPFQKYPRSSPPIQPIESEWIL